MIIFLVRNVEYAGVKQSVICNAKDRSFAAAKASGILLGDPNQYQITPLTAPSEKVTFDITVNS